MPPDPNREDWLSLHAKTEKDIVNYTATMTLDKDFMSESFDQARRYGSRWRLNELAIGVIFIVAGMVLLAYADWATALPVVLIVIGIFEIFVAESRSSFGSGNMAKARLQTQTLRCRSTIQASRQRAVFHLRAWLGKASRNVSVRRRGSCSGRKRECTSTFRRNRSERMR